MKNNKGQPEYGKMYSLTGGHGQPSILGGNTWAESEVKNPDALFVRKSVTITASHDALKPSICNGCGADRNDHNGFCNCNDD